MDTLVLGLGNPILTDDAVGLRVVRELRPHLARDPEVDLAEDCHGGLRLMERMIGYDRAIVVDAIRTGGTAGEIHRLPVDAIPTQHSASAHDANLSTALDLGRRIGIRLPRDRDIVLIGIEASDVTTFGESLTSDVEAAVPRAVATVLAALARGGKEDDLARDSASLPVLQRCH